MAAGFFMWIKAQPRSIPYLTEKIESDLNKFSSDFKVDVGDTILQWEGIKEGLGIHVINSRIISSYKGDIASFPDIKIGLDVFSLIFGNLKLNEVNISSPEIRVYAGAEISQDDKDFISSIPVTVYQQAVVEALSAIRKNDNYIPIERIILKNAKLIINNGREEVVWNIKNAYSDFMVVGDKATFQSGIDIILAGKETEIKSEGSLDEHGALRLKIGFSDIKASFVADVIPKLSWFQKVDMAVEGSFDFVITGDGNINSAEAHILTGKKNEFKEKGLYFDFLAKAKIHKKYKDNVNVPEVKITGSVKNLKNDDLEKYWPEDLGVDAREWVTKRIRSGIYSKAEAELNITPDDFINKRLSKTGLNATVEIEKARVNYFDDLPPLEDAFGVARFDGDSMEIAVNSAKVASSNITSGKVIMNGIPEPVTDVIISGKISGLASDLPVFMKLKADDGGSAKADISGEAETDFTLKFPLFREMKLADLTIEAKSDLAKAIIKDKEKDIQISNGQFELKLDKDKMSLLGKGYLNSVHSTINYNEFFAEKREFDSSFEITTYATPAELKRFGFPDLKPVSGSVGVKLLVSEKGKNKNIDIKIDAKDADIDIPEIGFKKLPEEAAEFSVSLKDENPKFYEVLSVAGKGKNINISGKGRVAKAEGYSQLDFPVVKFGRNDINATYGWEGNRSQVAIKGKVLDLAPIVANMAKPSDGKESFTEISANVEKMLMANDVEMENIVALFDCDHLFCDSADFSGKFVDGGAVEIFLKNQKSIRQGERGFSLRTDNAGGLLAGFNIMSQVKGGVMEAAADISENGKGLKNGQIAAKDFKVIKAPVLAKMLTLGSFTGILELLEGEGIGFKKLKSEFIFDDKNLRLIEGRTSGSSIGISFDGDVNTKEARVDIDGAIIPAYTLNSMLGDIPLIGNMLIGGEGQGLIATRYSLEGKFSEPEVSVNPFSILTPGFLRKIWGGKASENEEIREQQR